MEALQQQNIQTPELWIDLRSNPSGLTFEAEQIVVTNDLPEKQQATLPFCDIMVTTANAGGAQLAVVDVQGYRIALLNGTLQSILPLKVDVLLAGSQSPGTVQAQQVLTEGEYDWQSEWEDTRFRYAPLGGSVLVRPGRATQFKGETDVT